VPEISVIIHTKNAEKTLRWAIKSVVLWANEVIVVDMKSTDETVAIAKEMGARVLSVPDAKFADPARQFALDKAKGPWIFVLDADEEVPKTLAEQLQLLAGNMEVQAYELPRKNMIFGQWAKTGWWPDYIIRFFQKGTVTWPGEVHALPIATGMVVKLEAKEELAILHHNYDSVEDFITRLNRYTSLEAEQKSEQRPILRAFYDEFMRRYFADQGLMQGSYGVVLSLLQACYMLIAEIKRMERKGFSIDHQAQAFSEVEDTLDDVYRDLCYWIADMHVKTARSPFNRLYWRLRRKLRV
jgi:glycosyltransferase involved in cell wall biosynthesis